MTRYCFTSRVDPRHLDEYRDRHAAVWPDMLAALRDAGWRRYSLFLDDSGLLVGFFESDDKDLAQARMAATEVNARWQAQMADLFSGDGSPDEGFVYLPEVFNLEDQLRSAGLPFGSPAFDDGEAHVHVGPHRRVVPERCDDRTGSR